MFNMILNTKNYTGLKVTKLIDFQQLRLTGYADWYYNYSMSLPLWIYKIYQGSYDESMAHAKEILGMNVDTSKQTYSINFDVNNPYVRDPFYSLTYNEKEEHEVMPLYYPNFVGMTWDEAKQWAAENGATLNFEFISPDSADYVEEQDGYVMAQSLRYGILVSAGANTLTIMGDGKFRINFPSYDGWTVEEAIEWCKEKGYKYKTEAEITTDSEKNRVVSKMKQQEDDSVLIRYYVTGLEVPDYVGKTPSGTKYEQNGITLTFQIVEGDAAPDDASRGKVYKQSIEKGTLITENKTITLTVYKCDHTWSEWTTTKEPTCTEKGTKTRTCSKCGTTETKDIEALGHDFTGEPVIVDSTCSQTGTKTYTCKRTNCNETKVDVIEKKAHTYGEPVIIDATCTTDGTSTRTCTVCGNVETTVIPATGHTYAYDSGTGKDVCTKCGDAIEHVHDDPIDTSSCSPGGSITYNCGKCGSTLSYTCG